MHPSGSSLVSKVPPILLRKVDLPIPSVPSTSITCLFELLGLAYTMAKLNIFFQVQLGLHWSYDLKLLNAPNLIRLTGSFKSVYN